MEKIIYIGSVKVTVERPELTPAERTAREQTIKQALARYNERTEKPCYTH